MAEKREKKSKIVNDVNHPEGFNPSTPVKFEASQSSISIGRNAKGSPTFEIKVYDFDPEQAEDKAYEIFQRLNKKLPFEG